MSFFYTCLAFPFITHNAQQLVCGLNSVHVRRIE